MSTFYVDILCKNLYPSENTKYYPAISTSGRFYSPIIHGIPQVFRLYTHIERLNYYIALTLMER